MHHGFELEMGCIRGLYRIQCCDMVWPCVVQTLQNMRQVDSGDGCSEKKRWTFDSSSVTRLFVGKVISKNKYGVQH